MFADDDPQGHYHALGLAPNASSAQISHAYHEWAKAFHPDVTGSADTSDFRRIKEAYDTLSDGPRRRRYDALGRHPAADEAPPHAAAAHTHTASAEATHPPAETTCPPATAMRCCACNVISAQPRFCIFYRVISAVAFCRMNQLQGVYCRRCAAKKSLLEAAISWLLGWWSIIGILQTPVALWRNLHLGEKPRHPNACLLIAQARYFLSMKKVILANACVQQAALFAEDADAEILLSLRQSIGNDDTTTIRDEWVLYRHPDVLGHFMPFLVLAGIFLWHCISALSSSGTTKSSAVSSAATLARSASSSSAPATRSSDVRYVASGSATLWIEANGGYVNGGTLPQFTTVEVAGSSHNPDFVNARLPDGQAATLAASTLAIGDGTTAKLQWCNDPTQTSPRNGEIFRLDHPGPNRAVVTNTGTDAAVVKFRDLAGSVVVALFVDGHSEAVVKDFPDGLYRFEFATGVHWNRKCGFFEQGMDAQRLSTVETFASWEGTEIRQGKHVMVAHSRAANYMIPPAADAEVKPEPIEQEAFIRD